MFRRHLWRPGSARLVLLLVGLWLFGAGEAMIVAAELGNSPWTVLAEGVAENSVLDIGAATIALGGTVGIGTAAFALLIGPGVQKALEVASPPMAKLR